MEEHRMTSAQAEFVMEALRRVFPEVSLIDENEIKSNSAVVNPTTVNAFYEKKQLTRLELVGNEIYQIVAEYAEIDGKPCVIEMIKPLSGEQLVCPGGLEQFSGLVKSGNVYIDQLTGALDRRYYEEFLRNTRVNAGVVMIDIDDFSLYNDSQGHTAGDEALKASADAIRRSVRMTDTVIRYGGDEFLVIMPGLTEDRFAQQMRYIRRQIRKVEIAGKGEAKLSVSIGGVLAGNELLSSAVERAGKLMFVSQGQDNAAGDGESAISSKKLNVLIVDDSRLNREILSSMLGDQFSIMEASSGEECLELLKQYGTGISIVLLDILMPGMSGFDVLRYMNSDHWIDDIPVIMISSDYTAESVREAYDLGVTDYIRRPFDSKIVFHRVFNTIKLYSKQRRLVHLVTDQINEKEKNNDMMISILSHIVEFRNGESGMHVVHIRMLTEMLLEQLVKRTDRYALDNNTRMLITTGSALHDIGKIGIDDKILNKPGRLTPEEFEEMKKHTIIGAEMLKSLGRYQNEPLIKTAHEICRWHHERYDGRGYPDGLRGDEIPISAQVVSIADVYDALVSERVYKKALPHETAIKMINNGECGMFNPILLDCMMSIQEEIKERFKS
mgnify:FL=1